MTGVNLHHQMGVTLNRQKGVNFIIFCNKEHESTKYLTWISTHPDSKERAEYITEYSKGELADYNSILSKETWDKLKVELKD